MPQNYEKVSDEMHSLIIQKYDGGMRLVDIANLYDVELEIICLRFLAFCLGFRDESWLFSSLI